MENMDDIQDVLNQENTVEKAAELPPEAQSEETIEISRSYVAEQPDDVPQEDDLDVETDLEAERKRVRKEKRTRTVTAIFAAIAVVITSCVVSAFVVNSLWAQKFRLMNEAYNNRLNVLQEQLGNAPTANTAPNAQEPQTDQMLPAQVYEQCVNSVVGVKSITRSPGYFGQTSESYSTGSGVILSPDGYIATNYHVVEGGSQFSVTTYDDTEHTAKLVGYDSSNDIAVLKIEGENLPCATIGSSDSLFVGDKVAAIGNPLGELTATMTVGYISAKDRLVNTDGTAINMLQTDAAINSGNSGGPLFDMYGKVVGITTAKYSGQSTSGASIEGIGFAIPIDDVVDIIGDLMQYGYVTGAYLGVMVKEMDSSVAELYGLPLGVRVEEVTSGYCAEAAGMQVGDIIIDLGGYQVTCLSDLSRALRKFNPGDETTITVFRSGAEVHLEIKLSEKPAQTPSEQEETLPQNGDYDFWYDYFFGQG